MPRARNKSRRRILEYLSEFPVRVQTIPELGDIVSGKARVDDISDVEVEDLLGRDPVPPNPKLLLITVFKSGASTVARKTGMPSAFGSRFAMLTEPAMKLFSIINRQ